MPSQYEQGQIQQRDNRRRESNRRRAIHSILGKVAQALHLDHHAKKVTHKLERYTGVTAQTPETITVASTLRMGWRIFWSIACLAFGLDYMAAGHIGEALAQLIAPAFHPLNTNTPVAAFCIRQFAILLFVLAAVTCTLAAKYLSVCALNRLKTFRSEIQPRQHLQFWSATAGIWAVHIAKLSYIALLGLFYLGFLFGFAREYTVLEAQAKQQSVQGNQPPPFSITLDGTNAREQIEATQDDEKREAERAAASSAERLAGAPRTYYALIVLVHFCLIFFPVSGFSQVYHESKREKFSGKIVDTRHRESETLRAIYDQIRLAPNDLRQDLILAAEPVVDKINILYKRPVIQIAGRDGNSDGQAKDPGDEAAGAAVPSGQPEPPPQPGAPEAATPEQTPANTEESADVYAAIFGSQPQQPTT